MAHNTATGRARSSKRIGAILGVAAVGLMVALPLALNGFQGTAPATPGPGIYSAFTLPPTMTEGETQTTTVVLTAPAVAKAAPVVKAPHK
jgi:hypothetical protein